MPLTYAAKVDGSRRFHQDMALRDGDWKILVAQDFSKVELYNLKADPKEATELSEKKPERLAAMTKRLKELTAEVEKERPDWWKRLSPNGSGPVKKK
jgi:arylsulfatase A-like enzyme